ncbi:MAG: hypothetical protein CTY15_05605 [Methylocystis sp.]|nr:MAG: hypothetical protein CTY15_05605 [Methylocystis sp.]
MAGDVDALLRLFVEDVELRYNCSKVGLFPAGQWRGHEALRENLRRTDIDYEPLDAEILDLLVEGDRTAVRWTTNWRHRGTALHFAMDMAHFLHWRNGRVAEMNEFIDHRCVSRAVEAIPRSLEEMENPRPPGLSRDEMAHRATTLGNFSRSGPDIDLFRRFCAPDVVCEFAGDRKTISYAGRHRGIEALVNIVRAVDVDFEQFGAAMPEAVVDGGSVAVRRTVEWRHRGTGRRGIVELADFLRFEDGLIVELVEFRDSVALLRMQD